MKEAASCYRKAAAAGDGESWAILARFYFFYGDILQVRERDFTKAVKQAGSSGAVQLKRLLWMYYAGPEALNGEVFHKENAKKAFQLARQLAREGYAAFYPVLSSYYEIGYGTRKNSHLAAHWAEKARI